MLISHHFFKIRVHFLGLLIIKIVQRELLNDQYGAGDATRFVTAQVDPPECALVKEFADLENLVERSSLQLCQAACVL